MRAELTWLGHGTWLVETGGHTLLVDPFLGDNPAAPMRADEVAPDFILVSHGHFDHIADCAAIARRTKATVIANFEICQWLAAQGVENTLGHNLGGGSQHAFGRVQFTLAHHSSVLPDGTYGGNPAGFLLRLATGANIYLACDTALFLEMQLIGAVGLDLAVLPIGDLYTMGPDDALEATRLLKPRHVAPAHYDTWPPIAQDAAAWAERVRRETQATPHVVRPGGRIQLA